MASTQQPLSGDFPLLVPVEPAGPTASSARPCTQPSRPRDDRRMGPARGAPADDGAVLATVAHELRAPLSAVVATLECLQDYASLSSDDVVQLVARVERGVDWMARLLDDLQVWAALQEGRLVLARRDIALASCLEAALALCEPLLARRGQRVELRREGAPRIHGDPTLLRQAIVNLLVNATRYGAQGDVLVVELGGDRERAWLRITDHGRGVPETERERIFERHARGSAAAGIADGLGLGLHLVSSIVTLHRGTIDVASEPGSFTTFTLSFPRARGSASSRHAEQPREDVA